MSKQETTHGCAKCPFCANGNCRLAGDRMIPNMAIEENRIKNGDVPPEWCPICVDGIKTKEIPEETYNELCRLLTDYEHSNEYVWGSIDSMEWLDDFYDLCVKLRNSVIK